MPWSKAGTKALLGTDLGGDSGPTTTLGSRRAPAGGEPSWGSGRSGTSLGVQSSANLPVLCQPGLVSWLTDSQHNLQSPPPPKKNSPHPLFSLLDLATQDTSTLFHAALTFFPGAIPATPKPQTPASTQCVWSSRDRVILCLHPAP